MGRKSLHYLKYGIAADQKYLIEFVNDYGNLIINSRSIAHTPKSLSLFVPKISPKISFIIDPETHAFQHEPETLQSSSKKNKGKSIIKKSIINLIEAYGKPVLEVIKSGHILLPEDFRSNLLKGFCKRVLEFQMNTLQNQRHEEDVTEYYDFLKEKKRISDSDIEPLFVVAPYFYLDGYDYEEWLTLNLQAINASRSILTGNTSKLAGELVLSKDTLTKSDKLSKIIDGYNVAAIDTLLLWIDSFSEHEVSEENLSAYLQLMKSINKPIVRLHGSYFSILLNKLNIVNNLIGITHGLGYGEDRAVVPVGGGVPTAKFYLPTLHKRLIFRNALESVRALGGFKNKDAYLKNICDCAICNVVIKNKPANDFQAFGETKIGKDGREYPTSDAIELCLKHYMFCKIKEYSDMVVFKNILKELDNTYVKLKRVLPEKEIEHCKTWSNILGKNIPK